MTFREVASAMLRRWYVPMLVLLAAAAFTTHMVESGGVYNTRTAVMFINTRPSQVTIGPDNGTENDSIIAFAGAVANDINNGRPVARYAWNDAPFYGTGVRQGVFVGLRDDGGQWMTSFTRAELIIEIAGPNREYVESLQQELLVKVFDRARELQDPVHSDAAAIIRTEVVPLTMMIEQVYASKREQLSALAAMLIAAMIVGSWGAVRLDAFLLDRSARVDGKLEETDPLPEKVS